MPNYKATMVKSQAGGSSRIVMYLTREDPKIAYDDITAYANIIFGPGTELNPHFVTVEEMPVV